MHRIQGTQVTFSPGLLPCLLPGGPSQGILLVLRPEQAAGFPQAQGAGPSVQGSPRATNYKGYNGREAWLNMGHQISITPLGPSLRLSHASDSPAHQDAATLKEGL